ncbi:MAG: chitobiase/beta-hexosaminidase C-terminal domain-containing protein [Ruminococcus sp.]|nr:chitobiase/beta-hexosaminidase C-terminal domain-containing protein [Ruminococcus sp.]
MYFKAYKNGQWSDVAKWGVLNVQLDKPIIVQSGKKSDNKVKIYTQAKDSYIIYTTDSTIPSVNEGANKLTVKNGTIIWGTSGVITVPKGGTVRAIAVRCGLVTSYVATYYDVY